MSVTLHKENAKDKGSDEIDDLKKMQSQIKIMEEKVEAMLFRLEKK
jgi:hypothetical protein